MAGTLSFESNQSFSAVTSVGMMEQLHACGSDRSRRVPRVARLFPLNNCGVQPKVSPDRHMVDVSVELTLSPTSFKANSFNK